MFGECHAHLFMNGTDYREAVRTHKDGPDEQVVRQELRAYQDRGVTFVRDGGDHYGVSALGKRIACEYGIDYISPIFAIHKEGTYGKVVGRSFTDRQEYTRLVREAKEAGADFIKIMTTGIMTFESVGGLTSIPLNKEEVTWMVAIAHDAGMAVMSHTNGAEAAIIAAEAGVDSLEHGNFQSRESIQALAEHHVIWVPTTVTVRNLRGCGRFNDQVLEGIWEDVRDKIRYARQIGVQLALGSDAGAYMVGHGSGICDELESFREIFPEDPNLEQYLQAGEELIRKKFRVNSY